MSILIIGSAGYIGSMLAQELRHCYPVTTLDDCWFGYDIVPNMQCDFSDLPEEFYSEFDVIILLAGHSSVKMCEGPIIHAYNNNVSNFIKLISKLKQGQKLIYASSSSVYGNITKCIVDEMYSEFVPNNNYDITKHSIDLYAPRFDIEYYGLRFGTVCGISPVVRNDVMINSMTYTALMEKQIRLYVKDTQRPILGTADLLHAIKCIINTKKDLRGIYNVASFNSTAAAIAQGVGIVTGVPIVECLTDPKNITNAKMQTKCYDFSIDCSKFVNSFGFQPKETTESITTGLVQNFNLIKFTSRDRFRRYEK